MDDDDIALLTKIDKQGRGLKDFWFSPSVFSSALFTARVKEALGRRPGMMPWLITIAAIGLAGVVFFI